MYGSSVSVGALEMRTASYLSNLRAKRTFSHENWYFWRFSPMSNKNRAGTKLALRYGQEDTAETP